MVKSSQSNTVYTQMTHLRLIAIKIKNSINENLAKDFIRAVL